MPGVIALDAMGSDRAPKPEIEGAIQAARRFGIHVTLVGPEETLRAELSRHSLAPIPFPFLLLTPAKSSPWTTRPCRRCAPSAIRPCAWDCDWCARGRAAAFITAGNTGAAMATAKMVLGALPGVDRPALAAIIPTAVETVCTLLDVGANVDCKAHNLEQFAVMGDIYFRSMFGVEKPRVGLLSIGEEESKGNELTREAFGLLKQLPINFIGNVEGRDLYSGNVDVIVADGFVGNVALKTSEGVANLVRHVLKETLGCDHHEPGWISALAQRIRGFQEAPRPHRIRRRAAARVKGACFMTHGSSNANAIKNAIRVAAEFVERRINENIETELAHLHPISISQ